MEFPTQRYLKKFFASLTIDADEKGHYYKVILSETIKTFMADPSKENAYAVYTAFFDIYRLGNQGKSFVDLLDLLRAYEENAAAVVEGQRDHYVHSVNVFLLGICIYEQNSIVRDAVSNDIAISGNKLFSTDTEEFLVRWGIASLFHDIGYPMEIINRQVNSFISFVAADENREIGPFVSYIDFGKLNRIRTSGHENVFTVDGFNYNQSIPTDLLAYGIARKLNANPDDIKKTVDGFLGVMQKNGFVDHGYYSAIIVLKWYGEILLEAGEQSLLRNQIVDAAAAIYLHNAYKNVFQKKPFELGPLKVRCFPLAYLLILCDEAQEWNREAYGIHSEKKLKIDDSYTEITDDYIRFHYITSKGLLTDQFLTKKKELFYRLLNIYEVFPSGLSITTNEESQKLVEEIKSSSALPRLLAENIEAIAKQIHADYNKKQRQRYPERELDYPTWESLPDTLKYSNIRQAYTIVEKLREIGCSVVPAGQENSYDLSDDEVEYLSIREHNLWVEERVKNGWKYDEKRDPEAKTSPYIVPYSELPEDIKELDRDAIRNMKPLLQSVNLIIHKEN